MYLDALMGVMLTKLFGMSPDAIEKKNLMEARWKSLPEVLRTPNQIAGKTAVSCGATHHVMEKCNFSCTCCYLGPEANKTEPLPFEEVKEQLDVMRADFGAGGKVQITAGEVTLLPLEDLGRIVKYAIEIGLDPMVMSHGQRFYEEPEYLKALVRDYGLQKISIHIDTTQRGRKGTRREMSEKDLDKVRDKFAALIRRVRAETGCPLEAASTVTVTEDNIAGVEGITRWFFRNSDAFRLLSFLPVADVGRTRAAQGSVEREGLWEQIDGACGQVIHRTPLQFGHRECNNLIPLLLMNFGDEVVVFEPVRKDNVADQKMLARSINAIGYSVQWELPWQRNIGKVVKMVVTKPVFMGQCLLYSFVRVWSERVKIWGVIKKMVDKRQLPTVNPFLFVIHSFMSPGELLTDEGKDRIAACTFKVPVDGKLISMCEMNAAGIREKLDRNQIGSKQRGKKVEA